MKPLIIWGASGHAKVLGEFAGKTGYEVVALFDNDPRAKSPLGSVEVYHGASGFKTWRASHPDLKPHGMVAIGGARGEDRLRIQRELKKDGIIPASAVHPKAFVAGDALLGEGVQILAMAAIAAECRLGDACIVNTSASVDHECVLGEGVHVAPGAKLAGCVTVGDFTLIAVGAVILPRVIIGRQCVIGAGSVVTRDVPDGHVVYGNPARFVRQNYQS